MSPKEVGIISIFHSPIYLAIITATAIPVRALVGVLRVVALSHALAPRQQREQEGDRDTATLGLAFVVLSKGKLFENLLLSILHYLSTNCTKKEVLKKMCKRLERVN